MTTPDEPQEEERPHNRTPRKPCGCGKRAPEAPTE